MQLLYKKRKLTVAVLILFLLGDIAIGQDSTTACEKDLGKAVYFYGKYNYSGAIPLFETALQSCKLEKRFAENDYYSILAFLAISYYEAGREDSALVKGEPARAYFERTNERRAMYYELIARLGFCYEYYGEYQKAIIAFDKCSKFYAQRAGVNSNYYYVYAIKLAECYSAIGDFATSGYLYRSLRFALTTFGQQESTLYVSVITNMGNDYSRQGYYDSAFISQQESLLLRENLFGKKHIEYGKGLNNLAFVYSATGNYPKAITLYEEAKSIYEMESPSLDYAGLLTNLGNLYSKIDQYMRSTELLIQSLQIVKRFLGEYHIRVVQGIQDIALTYVGAGGENNIKDAIGFYRYALLISNKINATGTYDHAVLLSNTGAAYSETEKADSALYFLNQSVQLRRQLNRTHDEGFSIVLDNLADVYAKLKDYDKALVYHRQSIDLLKRLYGEDFPTYSTAISNLAVLSYRKGDVVKADSLLAFAYQLDKKYILGNTEGLSEDERESFAVGIRATSSFGMALRNKNILVEDGWLYNSSLFYKGLLLEGSKGLAKTFTKNTDEAFQRKAKEFLQLKALIGKEMLKSVINRRKDLYEIEKRAISLERELMQSSAQYRNWKEQFKTDWKTVQSKLKDDEVAIEFVSYRLLGEKYFDSTFNYAALLIKKGIKDPEIIYLFSDKEFNTLLSKSSSQEGVVKKLYRSVVKSSASQPTASDSLYHLIWKPLLPHLKNVQTIYFSADGVINNLNLAAIITPDGKRLVENYEFIQLSSTRNVWNASPQPSFTSMQLWGGVNYNGSTTTNTSNRSATFTYLPGTLTEINEIGAAAAKSHKKIKTVVAAEANESAFKKMNGNSPEVLHIATHGFFFPDPSKINQQQDNNRFANAANPLLRSGLALADANLNWNDGLVSSDKEDGILTAYEIADLDLSSTKLVVLSACETGLGDIKSGEGVYGLQRAFKMAGVNYLIMSLWQVPDMETKEFMQTFYTHCLSGVPLRKAFRETQLAMNKKYQPYQWAAFVLVE